MFFKKKNRNYRIKPQREETMLELAAGVMLCVTMFYILTVLVFSL